MKKKLFFAVCMLLVAVTAMAGSKVKVVDGDKSVLKEKATAALTIDYSNARWEVKEDFKTWCGSDYEDRVNKTTAIFVSSFNDNSSNLKIGNDNAKYDMVFTVTNMERHDSFTGMWGQCKVYVTGTIKIIDKASGNAVCTLQVDKCSGGADFVVTDGMVKCFKSLAKEVAKLK